MRPQLLLALIATGCASRAAVAPVPGSPAPAEVEEAALVDFVKAQRPRLIDCYDRELSKGVPFEAKALAHFTITRAGRAADFLLTDSTLPTEALGACLRGVVESWVFPFRPVDDTPVEYPFVFTLPAPL